MRTREYMGAHAPVDSGCCGCAHVAHSPAENARGTNFESRVSEMVWISGGNFQAGSMKFYPEERPVRQATVQGFWIEPHPVTNEQFDEFVEATGYQTLAERVPDATDYPDADPTLLVPASLVFTKPHHAVSLRDYRLWWRYVPGACWYQPGGPGSSLDGFEKHPVVHVALEDAKAYAAWAGKQLPTEDEWEYAAQGGMDGATYPWGEEFTPGGRHMANTWQGRFPYENLAEDGFEGTSPVKSYLPNGYGLYDMIGNVWEWTVSAYDVSSETGERKSCCTPSKNIGQATRIVVKGGSHLCAPNYCLRYRPSARQGQTIDTSTSHIGFRCVVHLPDSEKGKI